MTGTTQTRKFLHRRDLQNARIYSDLVVRIAQDVTEVDGRTAPVLGQSEASMPGRYAWEYNKARDGAREAAAALGLNEANVNQRQDSDSCQQAAALMLLDKLESAENAEPDKRPYLLSVDRSRDGRAAVAPGNPDTAGNTAVLVPGVGTELAGIRGPINRASLLQDTAIALNPVSRP